MKILQFALIIAVGVAIYANTFANPFIWDDEYSVINNEFIKHWRYAPKLFTHNFHPFAYRQSIFYRPFTSLTLLFDYRMWSLNPFGYHLTNLAFHIMGALALYFLVMRIAANAKVALISTLFFLVHPVHTQAITYISGRADPISALFVLMSLLFFMESFKEGNAAGIKGVVSLFFLAAAVLSKEMAVVAPVLFVLYEISFKPLSGRKKITFFQRYRYFFVASVMAACLFARHMVVRSIPRPVPPKIPGIGLLMAGGVKNIATYIRLLFLPIGLHMDRGQTTISSPMDVSLLFSFVLVIILIFLLRKFYQKDRVVFFGLGWFIICLLPVSVIFSLNASMAEHWLYLPSIGFIIALSRIFVVSQERGLMSKPALKVAGVALLVCALTALGYATIDRNRDWRDPVTFYKETIRYSPESPRLYYNLGNEYRLRKEWKEAEASYKEVIRLKPNFAPAHNNLGNIYHMKGDKAAAQREYEEALRCDPNLTAAGENLNRAAKEAN